MKPLDICSPPWLVLLAQMASAQSGYPNRPVKIAVGLHPARSRPCGAHLPTGSRKSGHAARGREYSRRRQQHRHRARRQGDRRWLHVADGRQLVAGHQSEPVLATLPFDRGSGTSHRSRRYSSRRMCSPCVRAAGQDRGGTGGAAKAKPGKPPTAMPASARRSIWPPKSVRIHGACRDCSSCPGSRHHGVDAGPARQPHYHVVRQYRERVPLAREGKLRALAITSIKRSAMAPDLPTMAGSAFPGFEARRGSDGRRADRHAEGRFGENCTAKPSRPWRCRKVQEVRRTGLDNWSATCSPKCTRIIRQATAPDGRK